LDIKQAVFRKGNIVFIFFYNQIIFFCNIYQICIKVNLISFYPFILCLYLSNIGIRIYVTYSFWQPSLQLHHHYIYITSLMHKEEYIKALLLFFLSYVFFFFTCSLLVYANNTRISWNGQQVEANCKINHHRGCSTEVCVRDKDSNEENVGYHCWRRE